MKTKIMTDSVLVNPYKKTDLSPFARFSIETRGMEFEDSRGRKIDKWEAFLVNNDPKVILSGKTKVTAHYTGHYPPYIPIMLAP